MSCMVLTSCAAPTAATAAVSSVRDDDAGQDGSMMDSPVLTAVVVAVDGGSGDVGEGAGSATRKT